MTKYLETLNKIGHLPKLEEGFKYIDNSSGQVNIYNHLGFSQTLYIDCEDAFNKKLYKADKVYAEFMEVKETTRTITTEVTECKVVWEESND